MGNMRFLTVTIPAVAIVTALSLPAAAQSTGGPPHAAPGKGPPPKAAPAPRGPAAGVRPAGPGAAARPAYAGHPRPAARPAYAGHPGPGHVGRPAFYARHPNFARRDFHGRFYRGSLAWERGTWRQEWRNGRYGWWWDVGGAWYFYEQPVYPYPTMISTVEVFEDPAMATAPPLDGAYDEPAPVVVAPPPAVVVAPPPAVVVAPPAVVVAPPPVVCVGPLCVR